MKSRKETSKLTKTYLPDDPISKLAFVGPASIKKLEILNIHTIKDLLYHFPFRFEDTRDISNIEDLKKKELGTIIAHLVQIKNFRSRSGKWLTKANFSDNSGNIGAIWFNQPYLTKSLRVGQSYILNGKVDRKWGPATISNPQIEVYLVDQKENSNIGKLSPIYPTTYGISQKWLRARIHGLKENIDQIIDDYLPTDIIKDQKMLTLSQAIEKIHFPSDTNDIKKAKYRLGMDELIDIQVKVQKQLNKEKKYESFKIKNKSSTTLENEFIRSLQFELTDCQKKAILEISKDLSSNSPMNRLLNGDVGSGKTIVSLAPAIETFACGYSTIIMAPTTVLATQHHKNIKRLLDNYSLKVPVRLLTSSHKEELTNQPQIIIGTHAILFEKELPENIAYLIIDEQHRFGVDQRNLLIKKIREKNKGKSPHYLTMTATPIPRTLTMSLFGYKDISVLDELPKGRKPIKSYLVPENKRQSSYQWIKEKLKLKEQLFIICALVEESEKVEAKSAKEEYLRIKSIFKNFKVALVHGQLKDQEKNNILDDFKAQKYDVLVATPVVEVGIDIPNATMMIIENAERFGLAQLHQFRGRIGRNQKEAHCFLFTDSDNDETTDRVKYFADHPSGFDVSEYDLKKRGPGEVYGNKQSGIINLRFAQITNMNYVKKAEKIAKTLITRDQE
ncbi:ATP-dependent DNA helicase RecG [Candidatus Dojkabacteria bacterium]|nr:ATP-dependent DNA helicase RecG [Candidatus Dojkabacteria bacterium]